MLLLNHNNLLKCVSSRVITRGYMKRVSIPVTWEGPEGEMKKLNFDGSCKGKNKECSIGGLLRDHNGEFLFGYSEPIGRSNSRSAELRALRRGLELTVQRGWGRIWVEGDAKSLVDAIVEGRSCVGFGGEEEDDLRNINLIMKALPCCLLTHIFREGNRAADAMAAMAHGLKKLSVWEHHPPPRVRRLVEEDAAGKTVLRKVNRHAIRHVVTLPQVKPLRKK